MSPDAGLPDSHGDAVANESRRGAKRKRRILMIQCRGAGGLHLDARTLDVSRGGMLVELTDAAIVGAKPTDGPRPADISHRVSARGADVFALFPDGIDVSFGEGAVLAHAKIVRYVSDPDRPEAVLLGCRFAPALSPVDCTLLGVEFDTDEDAKVNEASATPRPDGLIRLIDAPNRSWAERATPADATPIVRKPLPKIRVGGRIAIPSSAAPAPCAAPAPVLDRTGKPSLPTSNRSTIVVPPRAWRGAAPSPAGEGLSDEDLRSMGSARAAAPIAAVPGRAGDWVGSGRVTVYLFPSMAGALGPRYHGRLALFEDSHLVVDMPLPADETDPVGHAAGLGGQVRAVFVRDGRVLGESSCRLVRIDPLSEGPVRVAFVASEPPDAALLDQLASIEA